MRVKPQHCSEVSFRYYKAGMPARSLRSPDRVVLLTKNVYQLYKRQAMVYVYVC